MGMRIRYSPEARQDILKAQDYIRENFFDESAARKLGSTIVTTISLLKEQPNIGLPLSAKTGHETDLYYLIIEKKHMAFYRIIEDEIQIVRILDTRTNYMQMIFSE